MPSVQVWIPETTSHQEIHQHQIGTCNVTNPNYSTHISFKNGAIISPCLWHQRTAYIIQYQDRNILHIQHIDANPNQLVHQRIQDELSTGLGSCPICLTPFDIGTPITRLPCRHTYHHNCIRQWLHTRHMPILQTRYLGMRICQEKYIQYSLSM